MKEFIKSEDIDEDFKVEDSQSYAVEFAYVALMYKKYIAMTSIAVMVVFFVIALLMDKWYRSTSVILIPDKMSSPLEMLGGGIGNLSSVLTGNKTSNERYLAILNSRRLQEEVINKYDLTSVFNQRNMEETLKYFKNLLVIDADKKLGTISVTFEFRGDPVKAAEITNFIVQKLDEINQELATEQARSARIFIEGRYNQCRQELKSSEDSLNFFQKKYGVIEIKEQTGASIKAAAELYAEIVSTEVEYNVLKKSVSSNHPDLLRLESKLHELKTTQKKMESGGNNFDVLIPFNKTPDLALRYYRLYRDVQINGKILEFLVPQFEQAKIQEAKDTPTLLVLDKAIPAERHSRPKKLTISLLAGLVTFLAMVAGLFLREKYKGELIVSNLKNEKMKFVVQKLKLDKLFS